MGVARVSEGPLGIELCRPDSPSSLCIRRTREKTAHLHLAFTADTREQFLHEALALPSHMVIQPQVELAKPADAAPISAMSRDLIEHGLAWGWREDRILKAIADPETNVAVIRADGSVAAFALMAYAEEHAHLLLLAVLPSRQRQGLARRLIAWLEASARAAGVRCIQVEARRENVAARCLYNECGYHEVAIERRAYGSAVDGVRLEKWLREPRSHDGA